jgi:hypothetical protein
MAAVSAAAASRAARAGGLGGALDGPGVQADPGEVGQQRGGLAERDFGPGPGGHLGQARGQRHAGDAQLLVAGGEPVTAVPAVIPGPRHLHGPEHASDRLGPAAGEGGLVAVAETLSGGTARC